MVEPAAKLLNGKAGVQVPMVTLTAAPVLSTAVAPQVGAIAVPLGATFEAVQVMLVLTVLPGALTIGVVGCVTPMSAALAVTSKVAVSHTVMSGAGAHTLYKTVQVPVAGTS